MRQIPYILVAVCLWLASHTTGNAMTLERVGTDLFATGPTVGQDFISFRAAFAKGGIQRPGYSQVRWYRGSIEAWQAAGLPVVNRTRWP